jgi:hypothetical protein
MIDLGIEAGTSGTIARALTTRWQTRSLFLLEILTLGTDTNNLITVLE